MYNIPKIKFSTISNDGKNATFQINPLIGGFAHTIGNSLRRTLYSSTQGAAVTKMRIDGVTHEFTTVEGIKEDVLEIALNIKGLVFTKTVDGPVEVILSKNEVGEITGNDISETSEIKVVNKDHYLGSITNKDVEFVAHLTIETGYGYKSSHDNIHNSTLGVIELDAKYSPILNVSYTVEEEVVGTDSNFEKLNISVETDGSIDPEEALKNSANLLQIFYSKVIAPDMTLDTEVFEEEPLENESDVKLIAAKEVMIEDLNFPTRTTNALKKAGIRTLYELVKTPQTELLAIRNLGERSYLEIEKFKKEEGFV